MMDSYRREVNEFYSDENSVNLREFQRDQQNPNPNNLDLCDDDLFDDLFPATAEIDHCKDSGMSGFGECFSFFRTDAPIGWKWNSLLMLAKMRYVYVFCVVY